MAALTAHDPDSAFETVAAALDYLPDHTDEEPRAWPSDDPGTRRTPELRELLPAAATGDALLMDEWGNSTDLTEVNRIATEADQNMVGAQQVHSRANFHRVNAHGVDIDVSPDQCGLG